MHRLPPPTLLLLSALSLAPGCGGDPPAVAEVELDRTSLELPHRRFVSVDLSWRLREPLEGRPDNLFVFLHLREEPGGVVRTFDYPWRGGWRPGALLEHRVPLHQSALGPPLEPGTYALTLGLYQVDGRRWPLSTRGEVVDRREYRVADVRVPPESGRDPIFQFSPEWLDSEPGLDRQVPARRWLTGAGHLRVTGLQGSGEVWMRLLLPSPDDGQELVLADGASQQEAVVRTDCGEVEVRLAGVGSHGVVLPLAPGAETTSCAVEIRPNYYLLGLESADRRAVSLDGLAWNPS